ncbi:MAG: hypothetical protein KFF68_12210, partial [Desulfosarcina sp.]|nr:hypothetical protein [Desulfosarcina sp.]
FPGVVAGIARALPIFHRAGIYPAVNLGINRNVGGDATRWLHRKDFGSDNAVQGTDRSHSTVPIQNSDLFTPVFTGSPDPPLDADTCRQCDWGCFRDPSEMFGPLLYLFANPLGLIRRMASRPGSLATWAGDLSYYRACGFFNGRRPPDFQKLNRFSFSAIKAGSAQPSAINCRRFNQKLSVS